MLALQMLLNTASLGRFYPKSATVQNWFLVSEIATIYSSRFTFGIVQSASKRSCTASKFAQRRTSNKRFKFVRCAHWDCVPQPLNLIVRLTPEVLFLLILYRFQYRSRGFKSCVTLLHRKAFSLLNSIRALNVLPS
jgi:hypothetical protein